MIDNAKIEQYFDDVLEMKGFCKADEKAAQERLFLLHLYCADELLRLMTNAQEDNARFWFKVCRKATFVQNFYKEKKTRKKNNLPPAPLSTEKEIKEKAEIKQTNKGVASLSSLDERKKAFYADCHKYDVRYGSGMVDDFYVHWSEETSDGFMRFELEKTWSTSKRLFKWSRSAVTKENKLAALRLEEAKNRKTKPAPVLQNTPQQDAVARQRAADNALREAEIDKAKKEAVSLEEYQRQHPESTLGARLAKVQDTLGARLGKPKG